MTHIHHKSGWTRTASKNGNYIIAREDGTQIATVKFIGAGTWQNTANDDVQNIDTDRVVQTSGEPLPTWALDWLKIANIRTMKNARYDLCADLDNA